MKKIIWILIFILVLATVFLLRHKPTTHMADSDAMPMPSNSNSIKGRAAVVNSNGSVQGMAPSQTAPPAIINDRDKPEAFKQSVEDKNLPIDFHGRVMDQDGNPLSGVNISVKVRQWYVSSILDFDVGAHFIPINKQTESDGLFWIRGEKGDGFDIQGFEKPGYELEPMQHSFGAVGGSSENPVIFKMWNTNIHEQLITGEKKFPIVPDGRIYILNLAQGTIAESGDGDLKVWIQYTNQVIRGHLYDWSAGIEVINGGLCPSEVYAMFLAPDDGYVPTFRLEQQIKGGQSGEISERMFYLKIKNGQIFGKMTINLFAPYNNQNPGMIRLSYSINPSGSRILR